MSNIGGGPQRGYSGAVILPVVLRIAFFCRQSGRDRMYLTEAGMSK